MAFIKKAFILPYLIVSASIISCHQTEPVNQSGKDALYTHESLRLRWSSPENLNGTKGAGGMTNNGAKGRPNISLEDGSSFDLLNVEGMGVIHRIWITISDRSPVMLRSLKLEMFWDHQDKPAVSVPFGDFFGMGLGKTAVYENDLFANPEGRSFNAFIPMPFRSAACIRITNESGKRLDAMFFDVDYAMMSSWNEDFMYFHAYWDRDTATTLARDFELLPEVKGKGRFLGVNIGVNTREAYENSWWGEGEVKIFLDGDDENPTLNGTGTEDYIGTAWGQGEFMTRYTGCLLADPDQHQWAFYRYHLPDPIFFDKECRVTLQQMGGSQFDQVNRFQNHDLPLIPVTIALDSIYGMYYPDSVVDLDHPELPHGWTNFYRSDDVSATAYFYLDKPSDDLPRLAKRALRIHGLTDHGD